MDMLIIAKPVSMNMIKKEIAQNLFFQKRLLTILSIVVGANDIWKSKTSGGILHIVKNALKK